MGPGPSPRRPARLRRWLGWTRDLPTIAIGLDDDVATVLCVRRQSVITASGLAALAPGTVRNGRLRVANPAIEALSRLRDELHLPERSDVVVLVQPRSAEAAGRTVVAKVDADEVVARSQVVQAAGFAGPILDPVPAALARLGPIGDGPVYADGGGWRTYRDGDHLELEPSDRATIEATVGSSPVERNPLLGPDPIVIDHGVALSPGWSLLLGAALIQSDRHPIGRIEEIAPAAVGGWTIERVDDHGGSWR